MTSGKVSKKIRQLSRRQIRAMTADMWMEVNKQFFLMLPRLVFKERVKLAIRILRGKPIKTEVKK